MIYVTGDTHRDFSRFNEDSFPVQKEMTRDDTVIICGDFGGIWDGYLSRNEKSVLENLMEKPFTIVFCDGNHENFDRLFYYQEEEWNGGRIHHIRDNIYHLMRGEVYTIEGKKFFAFGGAASHDIRDGILDPAAFPEGDEDPAFYRTYMDLVKQKKQFRIKGISWWPQEVPTEEEYAHGLENLAKHDFSVDYMITHEGPGSLIRRFLGERYISSRLRDYMEELHERVNYGNWYFGHHHETIDLSEKDHMLFEDIVRIL